MSAAKRVSFMQKETRFTGRFSASVFETLRFAYSRYLGRMSVLLFIGFVGRFLLLSNANWIGAWVDTFCQAPAVCRPVPSFLMGLTPSEILLRLTGVTLAGFAMTLCFRLLFSRTSAKAVSHLYDEVTLRTSRLPMKFFDTTPVGAVVTRFSSDYGNVFRLFGGPLAEFCVIIFDLASMAILISIASPWSFPLVALGALLNFFIYRANRDRLREERRALSANRAPSIAHFAETTQGAGTIRVFARQATFLRRFRELNDAFLGQRLSTFTAVFRFNYQMSVLSASLLLAAGLGGFWLLRSGQVSVGSIGVAFTFIVLSSGSIQMFFEWMSQFEEAMTGVERLDHYLRRELEPGLRLPKRATFPTAHPTAHSTVSRDSDIAAQSTRFAMASNAEVRVENLWFRYDPNAPYVLQDVSFKVRPGERLGIVGRTGSGKSSLIQALFHLYPIERGRIAIDGYAPLLEMNRPPRVDEVELSRFRRSIALISQEPTLFRGSLRENLGLGASLPDATLTDAMERVGLLHWLRSQPRGLDVQIEERGRNLSLGERQLICMARCLLQNAPIIIMDEATSAIDPQSEEILVRATDEFFRGRTQLIIAHRLSTLETCDRILWLRDGRIHRLGPTHEVLFELRESRVREVAE
ncbi:MAG: ABC transporter ATP-binding protein/permease [Bdellovibrionaceae bacterium]|nr:ABC transporter ATP-binding protein/permease [Pseudobdellovibrionaceae bacterium]